MKNLFTVILLLAFFSCNNKSSKDWETAKDGSSKILARYIRADGTKDVAAMYRQITTGFRYDSVKAKKIIVVDTTWILPVQEWLRDSITKKIILDTLGNPSLNPKPKYYIINKDSVNWHVENVDVDSLLKPNAK